MLSGRFARAKPDKQPTTPPPVATVYQEPAPVHQKSTPSPPPIHPTLKASYIAAGVFWTLAVITAFVLIWRYFL